MNFKWGKLCFLLLFGKKTKDLQMKSQCRLCQQTFKTGRGTLMHLLKKHHLSGSEINAQDPPLMIGFFFFYSFPFSFFFFFNTKKKFFLRADSPQI